MAATKQLSADEKSYSKALTEMEKVSKVINDRTGDVARGATLRREQLQKDLSNTKVSNEYKRADAFLNRPSRDALMKYPELDAAFKAVVNVERNSAALPPAERAARISGVKLEIFEGLRDGNIPREGVSINESAHIISRSGAVRGLQVVDPQSIREPNTKGVVIAETSHHVLVQVGDGTAVRQERGVIQGVIKSGDVIAIKPNQHQYTVPSLGREAQVVVRDVQRDDVAARVKQQGIDGSRGAQPITADRQPSIKQPGRAAHSNETKVHEIAARDLSRGVSKALDSRNGGQALER